MTEIVEDVKQEHAMSVEERQTERMPRRQPASDLNQRRHEAGRPHVRRPATAPTAGTPPKPSATPAQNSGGPGAGSSAVVERARRPMVLFGIPVAPGWALVPLRLFLGVTFIYAGVQKLTDSQFFNPKAARYIGHQIQAFAHGSPISGLLLHVALPHAALFGGLIAYGELAIGLGTLVGLLARPAAFFGMLLSVIFFLSASWKVFPYFYGADIVFTFAWMALGLEPHAGLPNLDAAVARRVAARWRWSEGARRTVMALAFSVPAQAAETAATAATAATATAASAAPAGGRRVGSVGRQSARHSARWVQQQQQSRRSFLLGTVSGVVGALGVAWLWGAFHPAPAPAPSLDTGGAGSSGATGTGASGSTAATGSNVIAKVSDVPVNSAANFTIPSTGDPGVVVHLADGQFVAYDATCTHAGCPVQYDPGSKDLYCPCHGAMFDPANHAAVLQGPTDTPLTPVSVTVQSNGDIVLS